MRGHGLAGACALALLGIVAFGQSVPSAHGAVPSKKVCKTVKKAGKKVRQCRTVHPRPVPVLTPIATLVVRVPTATATPTARPAETRTPRLTVDIVGDVTAIRDAQTGVSADSSQYTFSDENGGGDIAPTGHLFLWMYVRERNTGATPYISSPNNWTLRSLDGTVYTGRPGYPPTETGPSLPSTSISTGEQNFGWVQFEVIDQKDLFSVVWNEHNAIAGAAYTTFNVAP